MFWERRNHKLIKQINTKHMTHMVWIRVIWFGSREHAKYENHCLKTYENADVGATSKMKCTLKRPKY